LKTSGFTKLANGFVRNVVFPLWARRDHPAFGAYVREFEQTQSWSPDALKALQLKRLQELLQHAYRHCAYYQHRMTEAGLPPEDVTSLEQLSPLPLLTKKDIQDYRNELQADNLLESGKVRNQTGGSTGSPLQFYVDRKRFDSRLASTVRHDEWAGLRPGDWFAMLWGARLDQDSGHGMWDWWRNTLLYRSVELNTSHIENADWAKFISRVRQKRPGVLLAYAQSAVLFARYLREQKIDDITFDSIITTAEVLLPGQRELLEEAFRGRVFNRYGCREVSVIASECEFHQGMHVNAEALLVEIVPAPSVKSPAGKIVVTDLLNFSMPLIRYEIGDVGTWADNQKCPCGRGLPLLGDVQGRITDFLVLANGASVSGPALTLVVADMEDVRQVQFVQKNANLVTLRVVRGRNYGTQTDDELRRRLGPYLGGQATLSIEPVDSVRSEVSGKYRFVVNEFEPVSQNIGESAVRH
jgi:phenylacetate-CoA ligase